MNITYKQIYDLLCTLGIPVAYDHFDSNKQVVPPFAVYRQTGADTFKANNKTYYKANNFEIELITTKKDLSKDESLEALLDNANIPYDVTEPVWDNDEKIYHTFYEI